MKSLVLTTVTAAVLALSAGTAFADQDRDRATQWRFLRHHATSTPIYEAPVRFFRSPTRYFTMSGPGRRVQQVSPTASDSARDQAERQRIFTNGY